MTLFHICCTFFFFNDTATTEIYTLSLHDALPISLDGAEREQLARAAADISLLPGEFAAHEGDEPAVFGVLGGRIEVVKLVDGIERLLGERLPGAILGEVPITFGALFSVGFRAAERSRVMRIEPRDYHAIAAVKPAVTAEVGRLAAHRMSGSRGLSGIAAEASPPRAVVLGARWDPASAELRRFLDRNQIRFKWLTPDAADLGVEWGGPLPAEADWPVIRLVDGQDSCAPAAAPRRRAARPQHRAACGRVRRRDRRRRSGGAGGRGLRCGRGAADALRRARGARGAGRHLLAHREQPRLPIGRDWRRA